VGASVSEFIQLAAPSFVKTRVLMLHHTYGEYEPAAKIMGAQINRVAMPSLRYNPSLELAFKLARLFDVKIEDIFIYEER
jgi:putative transcriptional regulator